MLEEEENIKRNVIGIHFYIFNIQQIFRVMLQFSQQFIFWYYLDFIISPRFHPLALIPLTGVNLVLLGDVNLVPLGDVSLLLLDDVNL